MSYVCLLGTSCGDCFAAGMNASSSPVNAHRGSASRDHERGSALTCARHLWQRIKDEDDKDMHITHNAYLKLFSLTEPLLVRHQNARLGGFVNWVKGWGVYLSGLVPSLLRWANRHGLWAYASPMQPALNGMIMALKYWQAAVPIQVKVWQTVNDMVNDMQRQEAACPPQVCVIHCNHTHLCLLPCPALLHRWMTVVSPMSSSCWMRHRTSTQSRSR